MYKKESKRITYESLTSGDVFWSETYQCLLKFCFYDDDFGFYCRYLDQSVSKGGIILKGTSDIYECPTLIKGLL